MAKDTHSLVNEWWGLATTDDETLPGIVLKACFQIDKIHGIVPDKPLIDMRNQTVVNSGLELMQKLKAIGSQEAQKYERMMEQIGRRFKGSNRPLSLLKSHGKIPQGL